MGMRQLKGAILPILRFALVGGLVITLSVGCAWIKPRSDFERDPVVMSHLARSQDLAFDQKEPDAERTSQVGWVENEPRKASPGPPTHRPTDRPSSVTHALDFSWVMGRIAQAPTDEKRLVLQFDGSDGQARAIPLDLHPSLQLVRPGDKVMVEGDLVSDDATGRRMRVRRVALIP
jgi:hypothetical protein